MIDTLITAGVVAGVLCVLGVLMMGERERRQKRNWIQRAFDKLSAPDERERECYCWLLKTESRALGAHCEVCHDRGECSCDRKKVRAFERKAGKEQ